MQKTVAVEDNLRPFKEYLAAQGCRIIDVEEAYKQPVDAIVISGLDQNLLGMEDIQIEVPVISVRGRTPEEVWDAIRDR